MLGTTVTVPIKCPDRLFIGGEWVKPSGATKFDLVNSGTEEVYASVAEAHEADVNRAVDAARRAFDAGPWPRMSQAERAVYIKAMAAELNARTVDIAGLWTMESGITYNHSLPYTASLSGVYEYYAGLAGTFPSSKNTSRQPAATWDSWSANRSVWWPR